MPEAPIDEHGDTSSLAPEIRAPWEVRRAAFGIVRRGPTQTYEASVREGYPFGPLGHSGGR